MWSTAALFQLLGSILLSPRLHPRDWWLSAAATVRVCVCVSVCVVVTDTGTQHRQHTRRVRVAGCCAGCEEERRAASRGLSCARDIPASPLPARRARRTRTELRRRARASPALPPLVEPDVDVGVP